MSLTVTDEKTRVGCGAELGSALGEGAATAVRSRTAKREEERELGVQFDGSQSCDRSRTEK